MRKLLDSQRSPSAEQRAGTHDKKLAPGEGVLHDWLRVDSIRSSSNYTAPCSSALGLQGYRPSGRRVLFTGIDTLRVVDFRVVERWVEGSSLEKTRQTGLIPSPEQQIWHGGNVLSFSNLSHRSRLATILDGLLWIGPTIVASKSIAFTGLECEFNPKRGTSDVPPFLALGLQFTSVGLAEVVIRTRNTGSFGWLWQISGPVLSPVRYNSRVGALASVCAILISQAQSSMEGNL